MMMIFNTILIIHFSAFLLYSCKLAILFPEKEKQTDKFGLLLGIFILLSGLVLVAIKYPAINYYKIIPKTLIFIAIAVLNAIYSKTILPKRIYWLIVALMLLASLIAVVKI